MENQSTEERTNSLMNKTKKQLIEIILRKDDVHRKLNGTIEDMKAHIQVIEKDHKELVEEHNKVISKNNQLITDNVKLSNDLNDVSGKFEQHKKGTINQLAALNRDYSTLKVQHTKLEVDVESYKDEIDNLTSNLVEYKNKNKVAYILTVLSTVIVGIACFFIGISI